MTAQNDIEPRWLTYKQASLYSSLSVRLLQNYTKDGHIRTSNIIAPGATRGRRLISRESLDSLIEAGIDRVANLSMNRTDTKTDSSTAPNGADPTATSSESSSL